MPVRVLVTGGTGYVGSWITVALMEAGHDVRQLVRRREQVALTFRPHGVEPSEVLVGDVTDPAVVKEAVDGCDAAVHAAAVYSFDPRRRVEVVATNVAATRLVLDAALAATPRTTDGRWWSCIPAPSSVPTTPTSASPQSSSHGSPAAG